MFSYRFLRTFIFCGTVIIFAGGCRVPTITSPTGDKTIQAGSSISFEAESYPDAIYKWTFDGGAKDAYGRNTTVRFDRSGVYNVCLTVVFNDFESGYAGLKVTVNGPLFGEALVEKTGQTTCYDTYGNVIDCTNTGQDGDILAGVSWPNPRFTDNSDGTVLDNLTRLIWLKQANYRSTASAGGTGTTTWNEAVNFCKALKDGYCRLSDGSSAGDWRLPNVKELQTLIHYGYYDPALPDTPGTNQWISGDPFNNVQSNHYWSSTTDPYYPDYAFTVHMNRGQVDIEGKRGDHYVWPVRGGE